jgi:glutaredoxin
MSPARCPDHDVALSPAGECVLCRRTATLEAGAAFRRRLAIAGALVVVLGVGAVVVARVVQAPPAAEIIRAPIATTPAADAPPTEPARTKQAPVIPPEELRRRDPDQSSIAAPADPAATDEHALAAARRRVSITMYSATWCGYCRRAHEWLRTEGISYDVHDIDEDERASAELGRLNPRRSVPTFVVDGTVMIGFSPDRLDQTIEQAARARL